MRAADKITVITQCSAGVSSALSITKFAVGLREQSEPQSQA